MSTAPRFHLRPGSGGHVADALRRLQAARLAEVEALGDLVSALAGADASVESTNSPADFEPCYLSVRQVAARIPYADQTILLRLATEDMSKSDAQRRTRRRPTLFHARPGEPTRRHTRPASPAAVTRA